MVVQWTESTITSAGWELNSGYRWSDFLKAGWWSLKSVWFEEQLFRKALLVLLIRCCPPIKKPAIRGPIHLQIIE